MSKKKKKNPPKEILFFFFLHLLEIQRTLRTAAGSEAQFVSVSVSE